MSVERFLICDKCGDSLRVMADEDASAWRAIEAESMGRRRSSMFIFAPPDDSCPKTLSWHICPPCVDKLTAWFGTQKSVEAAS